MATNLIANSKPLGEGITIVKDAMQNMHTTPKQK
jgi:hypothetical protein